MTEEAQSATELPNLFIFNHFRGAYVGYSIAAALLLFVVLGSISSVFSGSSTPRNWWIDMSVLWITVLHADRLGRGRRFAAPTDTSTHAPPAGPAAEATGEAVFSLLIVFLALFPLAWMIISGFKIRTGWSPRPSVLPEVWQWRTTRRSSPDSAFLRTLAIAGGGAVVFTTGSIAVNSMAYAFARLSSPGRSSYGRSC